MGLYTTGVARQRALTVDAGGASPHNGEGRPDLWFPDPLTGEMIGGQVASIRMAMRLPHVVLPWARRQGKSRSRQFLIPNEATITPGEYYFGMVLPDHQTAFKIAKAFEKAWGGMVLDKKINDKDQDRWIELQPCLPPKKKPPPDWFTVPMKKRWQICQKKGQGNTKVKCYFWSGKHPHYEGIQGDLHHYNRVDWDEVQQIHPLAHGIVRPMLRDVRGHEMFTGTPWSTGLGNVKFEAYWDVAGDMDALDWFRMRIPDGANPHVPATDIAQARKEGMTEAEIRQTLFAEFLSGEGAVFNNLDKVLVLDWLDPQHVDLAWLKALQRKHTFPSLEFWAHEAGPREGHIYALSCDWARSPQGDWTVVGVYDLTSMKQVFLARWRGYEFTQQAEFVLGLQEQYRANHLHSDANGMGIHMSDIMRRRHAKGFRAHKYGRLKSDYVRTSQLLFSDVDVRLIGCTEQKREFKSFTVFKSQSEGGEINFKYAATQGGHDDFVDSFMLIAKTIQMLGAQREPEEEEIPPNVFDEQGRTTLDLFTRDEPYAPDYPFRDPQQDEDGVDWSSVVLTR